MLNHKELLITAHNIRKKILMCGHNSSAVHYGGSLSGVELLTYIFATQHVSINENRNRFILSKGHCALLLYSVLCEFCFITNEDLLTFNENGGDFPSHCVKNLKKCIEISSGSLGLGLPYSAGQALALKRKKSDNKIFILAGNGEANEGSFWEGVMFAGANKLNNIVLILDNNKLQNDGFSKDILPIISWIDKFCSFGWDSVEINGHDFIEIEQAINTLSDKPLAIVANTIKGKGISFMENNPNWHHAALSNEQYEQAMNELGEC